MSFSLSHTKITVIISVLNGEKTLGRCLQSIFCQTYSPLEVIVIDGQSTDRTVNILKEYSHKLNYWVSEKDSGIYNAWNKALKKSSGDWICFLGCDDWWHSPDSLLKLAEYAHYPDNNFVSGKMYLVDENKNIIRSVGEALSYRGLGFGLRIAHPGALHHRSLFEAYGCFDESYRIAGDYEFLLRSSSSLKSTFVSKNIVCMGISGVSQSNWKLTAKEGYRALKKAESFGYFAAIRLYVRFYLAKIKNFILG